MKKRNPRHGSMQFWPRVKARRQHAYVRTWADKGQGILGFAGYKVGMTHLTITDNNPKSKTKSDIRYFICGFDTHWKPRRHYASCPKSLKRCSPPGC